MKFRDQKEKKEKEEEANTAKNFLTANPTVAKQLFDANDEDEISAVSKGLAKDPEGLKVINQLRGYEPVPRLVRRESQWMMPLKALHPD